MVTLTFSEELAEQLQRLAEREGRSVEDVVRDMVRHYPAAQEATVRDDDETPSPDPLVGLIGLLDEFTNATDLSGTVRETLREHTHPKYGWTRRGRTD